MGRDKATLPAGTGTLVHYLAHRLGAVVDETIVATGTDRGDLKGLRQVVDRHPGLGPLAGMQAGFQAAGYPLVWVVACDLPDVVPGVGALLRQAADGVDAAVPLIGGEPEGVCAVYRATLAQTIGQLLARGDRSVKSLLDAVAVRYVEEDLLRRVDPELRSFRNLNTPDDYEAWIRTR